MAVIAIAVKAQMRQNLGGKEGMAGEEGQAMTDVFAEGKVLINGEYWNATQRRTRGKGMQRSG